MAESNAVEETNVDEEVMNEALKFLDGACPFLMEKGMNPHVYANDTHNPVPYGLLDIMYRQAFDNRLGIAVCKDAVTGELATVLAFIGDRGEEDVEIFPVAVLLKGEDVARYRAPTGDGNYYEPAGE